jgi:archaemetzincin
MKWLFTQLFFLLIFGIFIIFPSFSALGDVPAAARFERLFPLHRVKTAPAPHDWLATHEEPGQTLDQYIGGRPILPDDRHQIIYVVLLGQFHQEQKDILRLTADFIHAFFQMPVRFLDPPGGALARDLQNIPPQARRRHPMTQDPQVLTRYILEEVLKPVFPDDAFCLIAFTTEDLWPGPGWNFVFGEASLEDRVGVWSMYRNGDPAKSPEDFQLCLKRTVKTGTHEIAHMFGVHHCVFFECAMNGSNHRRESDQRPLELCPVCLRKLTWAISFDPRERFRQLADLSGGWDWQEEKSFFLESLRHWQGADDKDPR